MSRKGNCRDNACSETLFGSLKVERLHGLHFESIRAAKDETLDWLLWYNNTRLHSTLNYVSPVQFEQDLDRGTEAGAGSGESSQKKAGYAMWKAENASHIRTASTTTN